MIEVQCRCGAVGLELPAIRLCNSIAIATTARPPTGRAYVPRRFIPAQAVELVGGKPTAMVVKAPQRMRCAVCGAFLYAELASVAMRSVSGYLLPKGAFKMTSR